LYQIHYLLPNNIILPTTLGKFEPDLMLVNINKLKPYRYIHEDVLKHVGKEGNQECTKIGSNPKLTITLMY
jgi:hypothetical protein